MNVIRINGSLTQKEGVGERIDDIEMMKNIISLEN